MPKKYKIEEILGKHNLLKPPLEEIETRNSLLPIKEVEFIISKLPTINAIITDGFTSEHFRTLNKEITPTAKLSSKVPVPFCIPRQ